MRVCDVAAANDDCYDLFGNVDTYAYCVQDNTTGYGGRKIACREEEYTQVEEIQDLSLFCTTRALQQDQKKICSTNPEDPLYEGGSCSQVYATNSTDEWYVADIDSFVVFVKHTFSASDLGISGTSKKTKGRLRSKSKTLCDRAHGPKADLRHGKRTHNEPCFIQPNNTYSSLGASSDLFDEIDLGVLLAADNDFSLDRYNSDANGTYREVGVQLTVQIEYNNREDWNTPTMPAYTYHVTHQKGSTASYEESYYSDYPQGLTVVQNSGVKIQFVQSGTFYSFDATEALIRITTALALFAAATFIVDLLAKYVMHHREKYYAIMYDESEDFGELCKREAIDAAAAASRGLAMPAAPPLPEQPRAPSPAASSPAAAAPKQSMFRGIRKMASSATGMGRAPPV